MSPRRPAHVRIPALVSLLFFLFAGCASPGEDQITAWINNGEFAKAEQGIVSMLQRDTAMTVQRRLFWEFEIERMRRIRLDFTKTESDVHAYVTRYIPAMDRGTYRRLEESHALEAMIIDGEKRYFHSAARNLFRLDPEAKLVWKEKFKNAPPDSGLAGEEGLDAHLREVIGAAVKSGKPYVRPVRLHITHTINVNPDAVPEGELIRCWIPFPREIPGRQESLTILATDPPQYVLADNGAHLQRTIYFEKRSPGPSETRFSVEYEYTSKGVFVPVDPANVKAAAITPELAPFVKEEPPHIVFTPELKDLSRKIVGSETNPYLIAQRLFAWADTNVTWATAREYSTVPNLSMYPFINRHGDCGMQTMLFITLCRLNDIPARWQSGWEFRPPDNSMHDWGMVYFEPYGWVPMDITYGMRETADDRLRFFYLNGMDSYRLIFNDAASTPFFPAKMFPRSETVDSQRGEVEWRGGNLYFNMWKWDLEWKVVR
jgi:hypothetical protein